MAIIINGKEEEKKTRKEKKKCFHIWKILNIKLEQIIIFK